MFHHSIHLLFLVLILLNQTIAAQNLIIKGHVCDSASQKPLYAANVVLRDRENNLFIGGTITNANGDFSFKKILYSDCSLVISYVGYKTKQLSFKLSPGNNYDLGDIELTESDTELDEIRVEWKPLIEYGDDGDVAVNLDMMGDIETLSVAETLESVPGFYFDFDDKPVYNGIGNYAIIINGKKILKTFLRPLTEGNNYTYSLRDIPAKYIKKVEIIPEPMGKYGFYTPIINLITKGELKDVCNADSGIGSKEKYNAGIGLFKNSGKFIFRPEINFSSTQNRTVNKENREFRGNAGVNNYSQKTTQNRFSEKGQAGLNISYNWEQGSWAETGFGSSFLPREEKNLSRTTSYPVAETLSENEKYFSKPRNYNASFSFSELIKLNQNKTLRLMSDLKYDYSDENENQHLASDYLQKKKRQNTDYSFTAHYYGNWKKMKYFVVAGMNYLNHYNFSERNIFSAETGQWTPLPYFSRDTRLQRTGSDIKLQLNRMIKSPARTQTFRLALSGLWNSDNTHNYSEGSKTIANRFRASNSFSYHNTNLFKQDFHLDYRYNVLWPSSDKMFSTPEYIDEQTVRVGNPGLKPEARSDFSFGFNKGYIPTGAIVISKTKFNPFGYSFSCNYSVVNNEIVGNKTLGEDKILVSSYTNSDKHSSWEATGNLTYNHKNKIRFYLGGSLSSSRFADNPDGYREGSYWNAYSRIRAKVLSFATIEMKYRYNSPQINYRSKIHQFHDLSVSVMKHFLKNNLAVRIEANNILSYKGIRTEYFGDNFYTNSVVYNESPVIWLRLNYVLFSFYSREEYEQ